MSSESGEGEAASVKVVRRMRAVEKSGEGERGRTMTVAFLYSTSTRLEVVEERPCPG